MKAKMDTPASSRTQEDMGALWSAMVSSACDLGMNRADAFVRYTLVADGIGMKLLNTAFDARVSIYGERKTHADVARAYIVFCEAVIAELKAKLEGRV